MNTPKKFRKTPWPESDVTPLYPREEQDACMKCEHCGKPVTALHIVDGCPAESRRAGRMSTPRKYRKKPVTIEAMRFGGAAGEALAVYGWIEENTLGSFEPTERIAGRKPWPKSGVAIDPRDGRLVIATLEGPHWANVGDWIIRGVAGEFYPCKPEIFAATHEEVQS